MGVKDLWNIISPLGDRKPLFELQGKAIAIDLSCWVVDSQTVTDNVAQPKMYLRNLFFRTTFLLMQGISPVFVLEGTAPDLKHKTMAKRNDARRCDNVKKQPKRAGRSRFNTILKECETMLGLMGLKCVKGTGEAEAMCAYLNNDGLVDGCISQDSDCFLYGAQTVYKNFCISGQGGGGSVDIFSMEDIERAYQLGRNKMIVLALLCGCDYNEGVRGVGKEAALKLFKLVADEEILDRIKSWSTDPKFDRLEAKIKDPNICSSCGHRGKVTLHKKSGCSDCGTVSKCDESYKETRALIANELAVRKQALMVEDFPSQELIDEFLVRKGRMPSSLDLQWKQPKILEFVNFMERHVCWEPEYAFSKIFLLTTRWQLRHFAHVPREDRILMWGTMIPEKIKKIRNIRGVASYEILWQDKDQILEGFALRETSDKENDSDDSSPSEPNELVSIEPQSAVLKCYPELVEEFENERLAKKKKPAKARKKKNPAPETTSEATETKKKATRTRKKAISAENKKIDDYVQAKVVETLEESFGSMTIETKRSKGDDQPKAVKKMPQIERILGAGINDSIDRMLHELTPEDFPMDGDEEDCELSFIVDEICGKNLTLDSFEGLENHENNCRGTDEIMESDKKRWIDNEDPINANLGAFGIDEPKESKESQNVSTEFDEFEITYVPLSQRIKLSKNVNTVL